MNSKILIIALVVVLAIAAVVAFILFFPAIKSLLSARTEVVISGPNLQVEQTVTAYNDWATGMNRERTEFKVTFRGSRVSPEKLKELVDVKSPGVVTNPTVYDAVALQPDDILVAASRDGQGVAYSIVRMTVVDGKLQANILEGAAGESQNNWFPKSRVEGWSRTIGLHDETFMIRHNPFAVVALQDGDLAKVELPYAFVASDAKAREKNSLRAINLETGKTVASLELSKECFMLPRFTINHPKLDAVSEHEDETQNFESSPAWWDANFEFTGGSGSAGSADATGSLKLRATHTLASPPAKRISIVVGENEIDSFPMINRDCSKENPNGAAKSKNLTAEIAGTLTPAEFCMGHDWKIAPGLQSRVCGTVKREKIFSSGKLVMNEISFSYLPTGAGAKPVPVVSPELELNGKRYLSVKNPTYEGDILIQEFVVLNPEQVLLKSRREGPWVTHLVTAAPGQEITVQHVGEFAYPGAAFEATADENYFYARAGGVLVRRVPFGYLDNYKGVMSSKDDKVAAFYVNDDQTSVHLDVSTFGETADMPQTSLWSASIPRSCFGADMPEHNFSANSTDMPTREKWFAKNFVWSADGKSLALRTPTGGNCVLTTKKP